MLYYFYITVTSSSSSIINYSNQFINNTRITRLSVFMLRPRLNGYINLSNNQKFINFLYVKNY